MNKKKSSLQRTHLIKSEAFVCTAHGLQSGNSLASYSFLGLHLDDKALTTCLTRAVFAERRRNLQAALSPPGQ